MRGPIPGRWYAQNTREPIRDETIRNGLMQVGAVVDRQGLPTTSSHPRYALARKFAELFDMNQTESDLERLIVKWRKENLSSSALARVQLIRRAVVASDEGVLVSFPNLETRRLAPGPSSMIARAVVEEFASRFLETPGVLWMSESGNKVVARDDALAQSIGLVIRADRNLPDIILVDLGPSEPLLVFVEVVATDGPVNEARKAAFLDLTAEAGFSERHVAFLTAYMDRDRAEFRKTFSSLAWQFFAWCVSEPEHIILLSRGSGERRKRLSELMKCQG